MTPGAAIRVSRGDHAGRTGRVERVDGRLVLVTFTTTGTMHWLLRSSVEVEDIRLVTLELTEAMGRKEAA